MDFYTFLTEDTDVEDTDVETTAELPDHVWQEILKLVPDSDLFAFACVCKKWRGLQLASPRDKLVTTSTEVLDEDADAGHVSPGWLMWHSEMLETKTGLPESKIWVTIARAAAMRGHLGVLQHWREQCGEVADEIIVPDKDRHNWVMNFHLCDDAAVGGHLDVLKWLHKEGCGFSNIATWNAAKGGHLEMLQWMRSQDPPAHWDEFTCAFAAAGGHLETLKWLHSEGCPWGKGMQRSTFNDASSRGYLEILRWMRSLNPPSPWEQMTCECAIIRGHLETLKWLKTEGCPWPEEVVPLAAEHGHVEILEWLRTEGEVFDEAVCTRAAREGKREVLKCLGRMAPPCPWSVQTSTAALEGGHAEVLKWVVSEGCPWVVGLCRQSDDPDIVSWVEETAL